MNREDLPLYSQLPNGCGLSSFLMLINLEKHVKYKNLLEEIFNRLNIRNYLKRDEFKWSYSLSYILLKSLGNNVLRDFLKKKNEILVKYYMPILLHELKEPKEPSLATHNVITPKILHSFVHDMKTDADLKILFYLFGGAFYPQEQEFLDGTGGLYFTREDFDNNNGKRHEKKLKLIMNHLWENKGKRIPVIALNKGYHWVAINSITPDKILIIHDPLGGKYFMEIKQSIPDYYRFYFFDHDPKNAFILQEQVRRFLFSEMSSESWKGKEKNLTE
ncbi:MAG: hypothetical protein ACTSU4_05505 [Promethearchaeota archaeon]